MSRFTRHATRFMALIGIAGFAFVAQAAAPVGNDWFQLLASPTTGGDNTGDGGTGNGNDLNYYYVGQSFTGTIQINVDSVSGSNASNIWIDYVTTTVGVSSLTTGSFFSSWSGQVVSSTIGRVFSTGFRTTGYSTGLGTFGTASFTMLRPSAANYGTSTPATLDINIGAVGATTESNISFDGTDILDDAEDFQLQIWADTKKPYALNPSPANAAVAVAIDANFTFDLRDSKNGEGDNSGVGTGVNTAEPPGVITTNDGGGAVDVTGFDSFSCSGTWGTNLCGVTVNPSSPSGIAGDTRNWAYSTTHTVTISGFRDLASASQDQLGDANGPNTMDTKIFTFTTEADTVAPQVAAETPVRASTGNSVSTNIVIDVTDRKTYPAGPSGVGVAPASCQFNISSPSVALVTYQQGSAGVTVAAIDYGYRYTINPPTDFAQNETVSVSAFNCADTVGNIMTTDNWTFLTADSAAPYVDQESPSNDQTATLTQNVSFHIKDAGSGVDATNTVIFVNGVYYTNGGGAGQVTVSGTSITFASSLNFNGGNYVGDTTARTGTASDYTFTIDPQASLTAGEAVPVIIFSRDLSGNLMPYVPFAFVATGSAGACPAGSTYCGTGTSFNGAQCVSSGGSCTVASVGGGSATRLEVNEPTVTVSQIDEQSALVTWSSSVPSSGQVVYGTRSSVSGAAPNFDYPLSTPVTDKLSTYHAVIVTGLKPGVVYFFKPVSRYYDQAVGGMERLMVAKFQSAPTPSVVEPMSRPGAPVPVPVSVPARSSSSDTSERPVSVPEPVRDPARVSPPSVTSSPEVALPRVDRITKQPDGFYLITGRANPDRRLTITIY